MAAEPVAAPVPRSERVRVRRNVRWLAAGILAIALGGLGTWGLFSMVADTRPVLKVVRTIYRGQAIQPGDLAVVAVGATSDVEALSGNELDKVVGRHAVTDLPGGSLLVAGSVGEAELAPGLARVGLKLEAGRIPNVKLRPGARVAVVFLPATGSAGQQAAPTPSVEAIVAGEPTPSADGSTLLDVNLPAESAEAVARAGAVQQIAVMQKADA